MVEHPSGRKSRPTLGGEEQKEEGSEVDQPITIPVTTNTTSPQSPCERTDLRMAIVADHLGLSWTELARELDFSVEEINSIRVENSNSLTAQSFMLLKKWVHRDGKNATTDTLSAVLTKINRLDIVTLLEGPIFDYGNISGTRCFADDNAVIPDQSDGYHQVDAELRTPPDLRCAPPTPLHSDDFLRDDGDGVVDSPSRPSELPLIREPPLVRVEDTTESPDNDRRAAQRRTMFEGAYAPYERQGGRREEEEEEEDEMTQERLRSLLEDIKLEEGGLEDEEMTEEKVHAILEQVRQAEKDLCSLPGWKGGDAVAAIDEASAELGPDAEEGSPDSLADSLEQPAPSSKKSEEEQGGDRSARRVQPGNGNNKQGRKGHS